MLFVLTLMLSVSHSVSAALVNVNFTGQIDYVQPLYDGIAHLSPVNGHFVYDDSLLSGIADEYVLLDSNPAFGLVFNIANTSYGEINDIRFGTGYPQVQFLDGILNGLDYTVENVERQGYTLSVYENYFSILNSDLEFIVEGTLSYSTPVPVPIPAAGGLFAFGLLIFGRFIRKRNLV